MVDVSFLKGLELLLRFSGVFLLICLKDGTFKFSLVVVISLLAFFLLDELIVKVLEILEVSNNLSFVILIASFLEGVIDDLEDLKVVSQFMEVLDGVFKRLDLVAANRENIKALQVVETFEHCDAV